MTIYKITVPAVFYAEGKTKKAALKKILKRSEPIRFIFSVPEYEEIIFGDVKKRRWQDFPELFGVVPDGTIADMFGVSRGLVARYRRKLGINAAGRASGKAIFV